MLALTIPFIKKLKHNGVAFFASQNFLDFCPALRAHLGLKKYISYQYIIYIDQLPVSLLAQMVERCTGIVEIMGSNPDGPEFFSSSYFQLLVQ